MRCTSVKFFTIITSIIILVGVATLPVVSKAADTTNAIDMVECGGYFGWLTVNCLVPSLAYYALYVPASNLFTFSGYIFDLVLALSIDQVFINQEFVSKLWEIVRDFSNMAFIFILLYTGIQTILGFGKWQSTIINVVIIALLVNFSMFFTKVVIDAGNILAVGVYESIGVEKVSGGSKSHKTAEMGRVAERSVSQSLVNGFAPQQFAALSANNRGAATTIFIISAIVSLYAAYIFIRVAILFIGRIIAFWFLIAISPFALISMTLPKGSIWSWWSSSVISQSFVAPMFLGCIYLIMAAVGGIENASGVGEILGKGDPNGTYFDAIVTPVVLTVAIIYALQKTLKYTVGMSGEFGKVGTSVVGKIMSSLPVGMAGRLALGGGAALLRRTVGSSANKVLQSGKLQQMTTNPNSRLARFTGKTLHGVAEKAQTSTFDVRNTDTMKWAVKSANKELGAKINFGKVDNKDGYKGLLEKIEKDAKAQAEKMKVTSAEKEKFGPGYSVAKENEEESKAILAEATTAHKNAQKKAKETKEWKEYERVEESVKTATSSFKSTEEGLVRQIEDLKKKQAKASFEDMVSLREEINKTEENLKQAKDNFENEKNKLRDAEIAYNATSEVMFVKEAEIAQKMAKDTYDRGQEIIKDTEKWENKQNEERRQYSADNSMNSFLSSNRYFVSKADRASVVKKIRKGDDKEKKNKEKIINDLVETVKAREAKEKKEVKEEKPEEEKKE